MSNTALVVLHSILANDSQNLQIWSQLKLSYFPVEYQPIFRAIHQFYNSHKKLPSLTELSLTLNRAISESPIYGMFLDFELPEDVEPTVALKILVDEYTQSLALDKIEKIVTKISELSTEDVVDRLANAAYEIEQETDVQSAIYSVQDVELFAEDVTKSFIPMGINNSMDAKIIGIARSEILLIGGYRGAGKSMVCSNLAVNEYLNGFVSVYYTIEMRAAQVHRRNIGIEAGISAMNLRNGTLTPAEKDAVARVLTNKYSDSEEAMKNYQEHRNLHTLEIELKKCTLIKDNQIIIVDNPQLSLVDIDTSLARLKALYGDKLRLVKIDYLNQIKVPDKYDWQSQIYISSTLKELAAKHDVAMAIPYQIDMNGEARFSKGILDSADMAIIIKGDKDPENPRLDIETTKARDTPPFKVRSVMDWETLQIKPIEAADPDSMKDNGEEEEDL